MRILVLQETDWLTRGPHIQHHIFETLSKNPLIKIIVIDYDIEKLEHNRSVLVGRHVFKNINRTTKNSNIYLIRTANISLPILRRITSVISNFFKILKIIKLERPDIIVGYSISNGLIGVLFSKIFKIPYIFHYIDILHKLVPISYLQDIGRIICRFVLKKADRVIVYTVFQKNFIIREGVKPENIQYLPNCVSFENMQINKLMYENLKKKFEINNTDFVLLYMGYLYNFSGLKEIIDRYNIDAKNGNIKLKFLILGDGEIYDFLFNYIQEINANWVILTGKVPYFEISNYIQLADLCVLNFEINDITSQITPIKIIEYMVMKKPVLSTRLPGVALEIGNNNGVIFVKSQKELIEKIGDLITRKEELVNIGLKGYNYVKINYSKEKVISNFKKIILETLKKKN